MKKTQEKGISRSELEAMSIARRQRTQRETEQRRLDIVREIEALLSDISKNKKGRSLRMRNPKRLGRRPNDTLED